MQALSIAVLYSKIYTKNLHKTMFACSGRLKITLQNQQALDKKYSREELFELELKINV